MTLWLVCSDEQVWFAVCCDFVVLYSLSWLYMHSVVFLYVVCKLCVKGVLDGFMVGV
jgi:hypothetical protein